MNTAILKNPSMSTVPAIPNEHGISAERFYNLQIFIPNKDKAGELIPGFDILFQKIITSICRITGGATVTKTKGYYQMTDLLICEDTLIISSFINEANLAIDLAPVVSLAEFYKSHTNQDAVLLTLGNYKIII